MNQAYFRVTPETELRRRDESPATAADTVAGVKFSLWITGPIAESHPVQFGAKRLVIE